MAYARHNLARTLVPLLCSSANLPAREGNLPRILRDDLENAVPDLLRRLVELTEFLLEVLLVRNKGTMGWST
jgi:hypothetical protein